MNRCGWPTERLATEHIVKFTAVTFAHGLRKLFFHAGTCGTINGPDAGGVLFEYGGAPRKMLPGVAVLSELFGTPEQFVRKIDTSNTLVYVFRKTQTAVAIAWCREGQKRMMNSSPEMHAYDVMGNPFSAQPIALDESPIYLLAEKPELIVRAVENQK